MGWCWSFWCYDIGGISGVVLVVLELVFGWGFLVFGHHSSTCLNNTPQSINKTIKHHTSENNIA